MEIIGFNAELEAVAELSIKCSLMGKTYCSYLYVQSLIGKWSFTVIFYKCSFLNKENSFDKQVFKIRILFKALIIDNCYIYWKEKQQVSECAYWKCRLQIFLSDLLKAYPQWLIFSLNGLVCLQVTTPFQN